MRYLILPLALLVGAFLWFTPFSSSSSPPSHDADAAIALALATFSPEAPTAPVSTPETISDPVKDAAKPLAPKCTCGCATTGVCTCGLKCPDILTDYEVAYARALEVGKPLLVDVRSDSCPWCDKLDAELAQVDLSEFVTCKLTASPYQAQQLGVTAFPTLLTIRGGQWGIRHVGFAPASTIRAALHPLRTLRSAGCPNGVCPDGSPCYPGCCPECPVQGNYTMPATNYTMPRATFGRVMGGACRSGH